MNLRRAAEGVRLRFVDKGKLPVGQRPIADDALVR
jgi:hypothetical protein